MCRSGCRRLPDAPAAPVSPRLVRFRVPLLRSPSEVSVSPPAASVGRALTAPTSRAFLSPVCHTGGHRPGSRRRRAVFSHSPGRQEFDVGLAGPRPRCHWGGAPPPNGGLPGSPPGSASPGGCVAPGSASDRPSPPPLRCVPSSPLLPS